MPGAARAGAGDGWLHTAGLPGRSAVDPHWVADPRTAARAIGAGLRLLHDPLPVDDCPFGPPAVGRADCDCRPTGWWSATATRAHPTR